MGDEMIIAVTPKAIVARKLAAAVESTGRTLSHVESVADLPDGADAGAVVVDLDLERSLEAPSAIRQRWPRALVAGFVSMPDRARWEAAQERGYDLVATRGAIGVQLLQALDSWQGPPAGTRVRLFEAADAAGRLGLVYRTAETPVGPVAVYHVGKQLSCVRDVCPHAGAALSEGEVHEGIVTCPRHGSQFDVRTGARVRGPADDPIPSFPVVIENGIVWIEIDEAGG